MEENCEKDEFQRTLKKKMAQANFDAKKFRDVVTADYVDARGISTSVAAAWFASTFSKIEAAANKQVDEAGAAGNKQVGEAGALDRLMYACSNLALSHSSTHPVAHIVVARLLLSSLTIPSRHSYSQ
jgi:hypothetical protein